MKIITKKMITPIQIKQSQQTPPIITNIYDNTYKITTLHDLIKMIYTHKHNYKPLFGKIKNHYNITLNTGICFPKIYEWDINHRWDCTIEYVYKVITSDERHNQHKNKYNIPSTQSIPSTLKTYERKQFYEAIWDLPLFQTKCFKGNRNMFSVSYEKMDLELYQLSKKYADKLPVKLEDRKDLYWQPVVW
jgi:hypothetical protein